MARFMLVDDDADAREGLVKLLEHAGHEVLSVPNGREALAEVIARQPDVVLLDLLMPVMDGPSFLEVVRSYLRIQSLPVVVYTGLADSPMMERARSLHVNAILIKGRATGEDVLKALEDAVGKIPS